jgi:prepilin-type N-terminal cleavage/methylation domain-containing protein
LKTAHARSGFTILEVLIAMAILLFGMTAILGLLTYGTALSRSAQLRTSAAAAAQATIADLEAAFFPEENGEAGEPRPIEGRAVPGVEGLVYSAHGRPNPARPLEYLVVIEMSWSSQGVQREKRFTTLLQREISFGERLRRRASPAAATPKNDTEPKAGDAPTPGAAPR